MVKYNFNMLSYNLYADLTKCDGCQGEWDDVDGIYFEEIHNKQFCPACLEALPENATDKE